MQKPTIKDSGKRQEFNTGSVRDTREGKGRYDLLPTRALARVAKHFEAGALKYGDGNWLKGQPLSRYMDSALRHAFAHLEGKRDEPHLDAAIWNLLALSETMERVKAGMLPQCLNDMVEGDTQEPPQYLSLQSLKRRGKGVTGLIENVVTIGKEIHFSSSKPAAKKKPANRSLFAKLEKASRPSSVNAHVRD